MGGAVTVVGFSVYRTLPWWVSDSLFSETAGRVMYLTLRGITKPVIFNVKLTALDDKPVNKAKRILVKVTASINYQG